MSRKDCEAKSTAPSSQSLLEETPGPLSQQAQATSSRDGEPLSSHGLSHGALVALQYVPFFRTNGQLLTEDELVPQPGFCREKLLPEDSAPPSGFCPYYRSKEDTFPSLALLSMPGEDPRDPAPRTEERAGCTMMAASSGPCHTAGSPCSPTCSPSLLASAAHPPESFLEAPLFSDATCMGHALCASGFVPYYRSPDEGLRTSPGTPASPPGLEGPTEGLTGLAQRCCEGIFPATPHFGKPALYEVENSSPQTWCHRTF
ncbi:uncharacterized protein [Dasypus novemcinctus]|uniref:uncharacterized protein n=1 Tax=Dasypus novemcinctus TaxID=9361 RepID=UPI00265DDB19|nr:uncharacterized protein LOC131280179 [Dasypus novemcinctus]